MRMLIILFVSLGLSGCEDSYSVDAKKEIFKAKVELFKECLALAPEGLSPAEKSTRVVLCSDAINRFRFDDSRSDVPPEVDNT